MGPLEWVAAAFASIFITSTPAKAPIIREITLVPVELIEEAPQNEDLSQELAPRILRKKIVLDCDSCVEWVRQYSKVGQAPRVEYAKDLMVNRSSAIPGYWVIFGEGFFGSAGHVGIVRKYEGTMLTFEGCNYPRGERRLMTIDISDYRKYGLKGFFSDK